MDSNLPYRIEYTPKDAQGHCKKCRRVFIHHHVRVAEMVQSKKHDYKYPMWYHRRCFFETHRPKATSQFHHFERIKYADQLEVMKIVDKKFEKLDVKKIITQKKAPTILHFGIEYSTSLADKCAVCKELIPLKELRIKKIDYNSENASKYGKDILWNHPECFIKQREKYGFVFSGKQLPGFRDLRDNHKKIIEEALPSLVAEKAEEATESFRNMNLSSREESSDFFVSDNVEEEKEEADDEAFKDPESALEIKIALQSEELSRVRAALKKVCTKDELIKLLVFNESAPVDGFDNLLDRCADFLTFGALYNCQKCSKGDMIFTKHGYTCNGMIDEWVRCGNFEKEPMRLKCFIPSSLEDIEFFATCEQKISNRAVRPKSEKVEEEAARSVQQPTTSNAIKKVASIKFKEGTVVDPRSKLVDTTHVYKYKETLFDCVLGLTDIQNDKNSYFKFQVLEADKDQPKKGYWLFISSGRIGTDIGKSNVEQFSSPIDACRKFEKLFEEKTGNSWRNRRNFRKIPGKFYPVEVTYNEDIKTNITTASKLSPAVEELMKLLFNVKNMTRAMKSFKLDLEKMPLGKLSVQQLRLARSTLEELKQAVDEKESQQKLTGLSDKFYTLVPHSFGLFQARVIDTNAEIAKKHEMIDSLIDIQKAYAIMLQSAPTNDVNSFDAYYKKLNAQITVVDPKSRGYELIERYVANTQVHGIKLTILEVFMVKRNGEKDRYEKYKQLDNRMLLWHGSRLTNFTSILSNGLKIGVAANGSMFGRGIYFADMVSKSSQYCVPTPPDNIGLLALSEVALGTMHEVQQAYNFVQPPAGKNSVKGVGRTRPNLKYAHKRKDGVVIPLGKPNSEAQQQAAIGGLLYNEYIVYNEDQVNLQYLVKIKIG